MALRPTLSDTLTFGPSDALHTAGVPSVLRAFDVWADAESGLTNRGTMSGLTIALETGVTDEGDYWDCSGGAAEGVTVDGYSGELTNGGTTHPGVAGNERLRGFMVCDMGAITTGSTNRIIWSNKTATTAAGAGMHIIEATANEFFPAINIADGTNSATSTPHGTDLEAAGKVMVFWQTLTFGIPFAQVNVVTSAGQQSVVSADMDAGSPGAVADFEHAAGMPMVFGAGNSADPPAAASGPDGAATWHVYAIGFDRSQNKVWSQADAEAVARYYKVM